MLLMGHVRSTAARDGGMNVRACLALALATAFWGCAPRPVFRHPTTPPDDQPPAVPIGGNAGDAAATIDGPGRPPDSPGAAVTDGGLDRGGLDGGGRATPPDAGPTPPDAAREVTATPADAAPAPDLALPRDAAPVTPPPPAMVMLPLIVTEQFGNQGWFGDATIAAHFAPGSGIIKQQPSTAGPCAARLPRARGQCLEVTYTPPPDLIPPATGGQIGAYLLAALTADHADAVPPARAGDPNWGLERGPTPPARPLQLSFRAAVALRPATVTFRAGTDQDTIRGPDTAVLLTTGWTAHSIPLTGGGGAGRGVVGPFAWLALDTTQPLTLYLDDIVWEPSDSP
jgi:hypothetical protein